MRGVLFALLCVRVLMHVCALVDVCMHVCVCMACTAVGACSRAPLRLRTPALACLCIGSCTCVCLCTCTRAHTYAKPPRLALVHGFCRALPCVRVCVPGCMHARVRVHACARPARACACLCPLSRPAMVWPLYPPGASASWCGGCSGVVAAAGSPRCFGPDAWPGDLTTLPTADSGCVLVAAMGQGGSERCDFDGAWFRPARKSLWRIACYTIASWRRGLGQKGAWPLDEPCTLLWLAPNVPPCPSITHHWYKSMPGLCRFYYACFASTPSLASRPSALVG